MVVMASARVMLRSGAKEPSGWPSTQPFTAAWLMYPAAQWPEMSEKRSSLW